MKYIDAEKLIAEIERRISIKENLTQRPEMSDMKESLYDIIGAYQSLKSFITSLQQEQLDANKIEKALSLQIQAYLTTASDELYAPGKPLYTEAHHKGIHECMLMWQKLHQYYFSTMQEQPEVDLEKASRNVYESWIGGTMNDVRRDMVELGKVLNARKEGTK